MAVSVISMMLIVGTMLPAVARAGSFADTVVDFFGAFSIVIRGNIATADTVTSTVNVQNIALPEASLNVAHASDRGGGDITIEDASALVPDRGVFASVINPANATISTYVVKEGDTLSQIAELFQVTADTIRWSNDLTRTSSLKVGQVLTILPVSGIKYTVKKGDTLASIAERYEGDVGEIVSYNGIVDGSLAAGAEIIVPNGKIPAPPTPAVVKTVKKVVKTVARTVGNFSAPLSSYEKTQGIHGYNGVDLAAAIGAPILAAAEGSVIIAKNSGYNGGYGKYVVIQHDDNSQTLYAHASSVSVSVGERVSRGQVIGGVGNTGRSTGPHLHFEIRNGGRNPF